MKLIEKKDVLLLEIPLEELNKLLNGTALIVGSRDPRFEKFAVCKEEENIKIFKVTNEIIPIVKGETCAK